MENLNEVTFDRQIGRTIKNHNLIPNLFKNSWWTNGLEDWIVNVGNLSVEEDAFGFNNLVINSEQSTQVKQTLRLKPEHVYFLTLDVKIERYVQGLFGIYFNGSFKNCASDIGLRRKSKGEEYETIIVRLETTNDWVNPQNVFVGSVGSANVTGKIRKLSLYDLTEIFGSGNEPYEADFLKVLPSLQDSKGAYLDVVELLSSSINDQKISTNVTIHQTKRDVIKLFINEMNKKAVTLGMTDTKFRNVNGFRANGQVTTVNDFLKLGLYSTGFSELLKIWGKKEHDVSIFGDFEREISISSTVKLNNLDRTEILLGGKTGTIGNDIQNIFSVISDSDKEIYLIVVFGASGKNAHQDRIQAVKELLNIARIERQNPTTHPHQLKRIEAGGVIKLPLGNPFFYTNSSLELLYGLNENKKVEPASLIKIMTAILLLENIDNLNQQVTIVPSDIIGGSGPILHAGDRVSLLDILHLLMLPSSNTAAKTIARVVGQKLLTVN